MTTRFVILGGGTAGWMAANFLISKWPDKNVSVRLVESPDIKTVGVGEGSTPSLKRFFQFLGVDERDWMPKCNATYKVNIRFVDWSNDPQYNSYSHPFQSQVDVFNEKAFYSNCLNRRHGLDVHTRPDDFFINGVLAKLNKGPITPDNFPFRMEYGYHFDSQCLGEYLAELAVSRGVEYTQARISHIDQAEGGNITALNGDKGEKIEGDFFVDCSGFASVLMQKTLGVKFHDFKSNLFNDSAVVMATPVDKKIPVETVSYAMSNGWRWKIPLTNRYGNGYVYSSDFISDDKAEFELRESLGMLDSPELTRHLRMRVGQLEKHWEQNCLGLGLSQGFIEPLEATALHLVEVCLQEFVNAIDLADLSASAKGDFNQKMTNNFEGVRDYIVAHYKLNRRSDSEYWVANRENNALSNSLTQLLEVWFARGDITHELAHQNIRSHFNSLSWHCLLSGYGVYPDLLSKQSGNVDFYVHQGVERLLSGSALNFNEHGQNLQRNS